MMDADTGHSDRGLCAFAGSRHKSATDGLSQAYGGTIEVYVF